MPAKNQDDLADTVDENKNKYAIAFFRCLNE